MGQDKNNNFKGIITAGHVYSTQEMGWALSLPNIRQAAEQSLFLLGRKKAQSLYILKQKIRNSKVLKSL